MTAENTDVEVDENLDPTETSILAKVKHMEAILKEVDENLDPTETSILAKVADTDLKVKHMEAILKEIDESRPNIEKMYEKMEEFGFSDVLTDFWIRLDEDNVKKLMSNGSGLNFQQQAPNKVQDFLDLYDTYKQSMAWLAYFPKVLVDENLQTPVIAKGEFNSLKEMHADARESLQYQIAEEKERAQILRTLVTNVPYGEVLHFPVHGVFMTPVQPASSSSSQQE